MRYNVSSETGRLKSVIVHTPGREVALVNPEFKDELLFDDIVFEQDARNEHLGMLDIFKTALPENGEIFEITDLLLECFQKPEAKVDFIDHMVDRLTQQNLHTVKSDLLELSAVELLQFSIQGFTPGIPEFSLPPTPNLLFTRDLAAVINDSILISRAAKTARIREFLLMEALVAYHPLFEELRKNKITIASSETIEGGDVLVASENLVLIGMSERTSFSGLMTAAKGLLSKGVEHILAVDIPKQRSSMHLDTIFTFASDDECIAFPPAITDRSGYVIHLTSHNDAVKAEKMGNLNEALEELLGRPVTFINCGGDDRTDQFREQWTDGANVFALAPGVIVGYGRNANTFNTLKEHGYTLMNQFEFVDEYKDRELDEGKKIAISFQGHELCRGRGGARCMTMPLARSN